MLHFVASVKPANDNHQVYYPSSMPDTTLSSWCNCGSLDHSMNQHMNMLYAYAN